MPKKLRRANLISPRLFRPAMLGAGCSRPVSYTHLDVYKRQLMAKKLSWRMAPELRFVLDSSVDEAERIASALARDAARNSSDEEE